METQHIVPRAIRTRDGEIPFRLDLPTSDEVLALNTFTSRIKARVGRVAHAAFVKLIQKAQNNTSSQHKGKSKSQIQHHAAVNEDSSPSNANVFSLHMVNDDQGVEPCQTLLQNGRDAWATDIDELINQDWNFPIIPRDDNQVVPTPPQNSPEFDFDKFTQEYPWSPMSPMEEDFNSMISTMLQSDIAHRITPEPETLNDSDGEHSSIPQASVSGSKTHIDWPHRTWPQVCKMHMAHHHLERSMLYLLEILKLQEHVVDTGISEYQQSTLSNPHIFQSYDAEDSLIVLKYNETYRETMKKVLFDLLRKIRDAITVKYRVDQLSKSNPLHSSANPQPIDFPSGPLMPPSDQDLLNPVAFPPNAIPPPTPIIIPELNLTSEDVSSSLQRHDLVWETANKQCGCCPGILTSPYVMHLNPQTINGVQCEQLLLFDASVVLCHEYPNFPSVRTAEGVVTLFQCPTPSTASQDPTQPGSLGVA